MRRTATYFIAIVTVALCGALGRAYAEEPLATTDLRIAGVRLLIAADSQAQTVPRNQATGIATLLVDSFDTTRSIRTTSAPGR